MPDPATDGVPPPPETIYGGALGELDQIDQAVYLAIAATPSVGDELPLHALAATVACSRVHTDVHHPVPR